jgi:membrane protein
LSQKRPNRLLLYVKGVCNFILLCIHEVWSFFCQAFRSFLDDNAVRMAAALAFYSMFSIVPAFLIALTISGFIIGATRAENELISRLEYLMTPDSAEYVAFLIRHFSAQLKEQSLSIVALVGAILAGTAVFVELHSSLNTIWGVSAGDRNGLILVLRARAISFVCVVGLGVLILIAVIASALLAAVTTFFQSALFVPSSVVGLLYAATQFGMVPVMLVLIYKLIPDADIKWKDVLAGAIITSFLFLAGKRIFLYLLSASLLKSVYGAAGSLFILLVWIYYSAQVFYFGAELTKVYTMRYGSRANLNH